MKLRYRSIAMALGIWLLTSATAEAAPEVGALPLHAEHCRSLGSVVGQSGYGKNPGWQSIATYYALKRAEGLGATHTVLRSTRTIGVYNGEVTLEAFHCPLKEG